MVGFCVLEQVFEDVDVGVVFVDQCVYVDQEEVEQGVCYVVFLLVVLVVDLVVQCFEVVYVWFVYLGFGYCVDVVCGDVGVEWFDWCGDEGGCDVQWMFIGE